MPGLRASERPSALCPIDLETFPFWGQPIIRVWLVVHTVPAVCAGVTTPQCTFSYLAHSRFPECFCHPVWQLHSLLPAFDPRLPVARRGKGLSPVHQRGRGCCDTACAVSFTCMDMQLRKSSDFRRPAPILSDSFGRTGRTHRLHRIRRLVALSATSRPCRYACRWVFVIDYPDNFGKPLVSRKYQTRRDSNAQAPTSRFCCCPHWICLWRNWHDCWRTYRRKLCRAIRFQRRSGL